jgi:hypothetical protein
MPSPRSDTQKAGRDNPFQPPQPFLQKLRLFLQPQRHDFGDIVDPRPAPGAGCATSKAQEQIYALRRLLQLADPCRQGREYLEEIAYDSKGDFGASLNGRLSLKKVGI